MLDTHVWVQWVGDVDALPEQHRQVIAQNESEGIGVSVISCWEVVSLGRLQLARPVLEWIHGALDYPGVQLLELTPRITVESTTLPGEFHRDPADRLIVATARSLDGAVVTRDQRIISYEHVQSIGPS